MQERSPEFKNMIKKAIILGSGLFLGLFVVLVGLAFVNKPTVLIWVGWGLWFVGLAFSFSKVLFSKKKVLDMREEVLELKEEIRELKAENKALIYDLIARSRPVIQQGPTIISETSHSGSSELGVDEVIREMEKNVGDYSYYDLEQKKKEWSQSTTLTGKILNWQKFWTRHEGRDRSLSKNIILSNETDMNKKNPPLKRKPAH